MKKCLILLTIFIISFSILIDITTSFVILENSSSINTPDQEVNQITGFSIKETRLSKSLGSFIELLRKKFKISEVDFTVMTVKESQGSFTIQNFAPILTANIPNQQWNSTSNPNAFDLDDYFIEPNGENITYSVTGNVSIVVTISAENVVSFSNPSTFSNSQETVTFYASDGNSNTPSNSVNLIVGEIPEEPGPSGGGGGGGGAVAAPKEIPEFTPDFTVDPNFFRITIKQGESQTKVVEIKNTGNTILAINLEIGSLKRFIKPSEQAFSLAPDASKTISLDISVEEYEIPDIFIGRILLEGGGITRIINIIIEVKAKVPLFDVHVETIDKTVTPEEEVDANINIANFGDLDYMDLSLYYAIKDFDGNVITFNEEDITVGNELSIVRSLKFPKDYSCVDYIMYAKATYLDISSTSADIFKVSCEKELLAPPKIIVEGKSIIYLLIGLVAFLVLTVIFVMIEHKKLRVLIKSALPSKKLKKRKYLFRRKGKPKRFCKKCGARLKGKKRYCSKCGTEIS
jgi:hypothetical protein